MMKKTLALLLLCLSAHASAEMIAWLGNQAGGRIVITDEVCVDPVTKERYDQLKRAYNYGASGGTSEGCYLLEDESIVIVWVNSNGRNKSRYPLENFTFNTNYKSKSRNRSTM
jgi:hypothetical protein